MVGFRSRSDGPVTRPDIDPYDRPESWRIVDHRVLARGRVSDFVEDVVEAPDGVRFTRQWVTHPGAVAVIALRDDHRVAVIHQYRHPVGMRLIEPPAGLLDMDGEDWLVAAQRELAEEALLRADDWRVLVDIFTTPGGVAETIRIYLARGLHRAEPPDGFEAEHEEAHMDLGWVALDDLVDAVFAGHVQSPSMVSGVLALQAAEATGRLDTLRPADAPWPARDVWQRRNRELAGLDG